MARETNLTHAPVLNFSLKISVFLSKDKFVAAESNKFRNFAFKSNAQISFVCSTNHNPILQYVILRKDLWKELKWPLGSVVAQGCHAATAALWLSKDQKITQTYCAPLNIDHMHKV